MKLETLSKRKAIVGIIAAVSALLVLSALGVVGPIQLGNVSLLANTPPNNPGPPSGSGSNPTQKFTISGTVTGLIPDATRQLPLTLRNSAPFAVKVTKLTVTAANSNKTGCSRLNLIVPSFVDQAGGADDVIIPRNGHTVKSVPMGMVANPANACQGATWKLTYTGEAVQA